jgi:hypothetical protein
MKKNSFLICTILGVLSVILMFTANVGEWSNQMFSAPYFLSLFFVLAFSFLICFGIFTKNRKMILFAVLAMLAYDAIDGSKTAISYFQDAGTLEDGEWATVDAFYGLVGLACFSALILFALDYLMDIRKFDIVILFILFGISFFLFLILIIMIVRLGQGQYFWFEFLFHFAEFLFFIELIFGFNYLYVAKDRNTPAPEVQDTESK